MTSSSRSVLPLATLMILALTTSDAQALSVVDAGMKAGVAQTRMNFAGYDRFDGRPGLTAGLFLTVELADRLAVQPQALYVCRGGAYRDQGGGPWGTLEWVHLAEFRLDYLEIPVLLRYDLLSDRAWTPVLLAGPAWGRLLSARYIQNDWSDAGWLRHHDWALLVGAGLERRTSGATWSLELLYRHALTGIAKGPPPPTTEVDGLSLMVGLGF
ncbi:MAG: porin family protein [Candidatus Latescibacteria bacterium]|nr:porin family protein [Candidatus Latescibacterota bacterium]